MTMWMSRAGKHGEYESLALENGLAVIGWGMVGDLSGTKLREELEHLLQRTYPEDKVATIRNWTGQLWAFFHSMHTGDLIALPQKKQSAIALGRIAGDYAYRPDFPEGARHTRPVEWTRPDMPRSAFDQDLLYSLGAFLTVCKIDRNDAEERVRAMLSGKTTPRVKPSQTEPPLDLEQYGIDLIREHVGRKFKGHDLERLVEAVLRAQGYSTLRTERGADGGVDIVGGRGPLGFEAPKLCVQVKSSTSPEDIKTVRELDGVLKAFQADQGLLVCWGGFRDSVMREARRRFFQVRLWDADDLLRAVLETYDHFPEELKAELPLKKIWTLVREEE